MDPAVSAELREVFASEVYPAIMPARDPGHAREVAGAVRNAERDVGGGERAAELPDARAHRLDAGDLALRRREHRVRQAAGGEQFHAPRVMGWIPRRRER